MDEIKNIVNQINAGKIKAENIPWQELTNDFCTNKMQWIIHYVDEDKLENVKNCMAQCWYNVIGLYDWQSSIYNVPPKPAQEYRLDHGGGAAQGTPVQSSASGHTRPYRQAHRESDAYPEDHAAPRRETDGFQTTAAAAAARTGEDGLEKQGFQEGNDEVYPGCVL